MKVPIITAKNQLPKPATEKELQLAMKKLMKQAIMLWSELMATICYLKSLSERELDFLYRGIVIYARVIKKGVGTNIYLESGDDADNEVFYKPLIEENNAEFD